MLSCTGKRSHRHTILHVSFSNSFGLASERPTPQGLSGAPLLVFVWHVQLSYILQVSTNTIACYYSVGHICEDPLSHSPLYCSLWVIFQLHFFLVGLLTLACFFVEVVSLQFLAANSTRTTIGYFYLFMYRECKSNYFLSVFFFFGVILVLNSATLL